ncbi:MAG TPA: hypothetical protein VGD97_00120 [Lacunisphaera sp.]
MELSRGFKRLLVVAAIAYAVWLGWYHSPYAGGSDSSGYLNSARLLLEGKITTQPRLLSGAPADLLEPLHYVAPGFRLTLKQPGVSPTYPIGLPLHLAAAGLVVDLEHAATVVSLLAAAALAGLLYLCAREFGVRPNWSASLAALFLLSPLTLFLSLQPLSDQVATVWAIAVVYCALRADRHLGWAAGAGLALAVAVLVRPTNLLLFLPAAIALPARVRPWLAFLLAGLPGAAFLAFYNHTLHGAAWSTGYGSLGYLVDRAYIWVTLRHYAIWVPVVATPLAVAALALPWLRLERRKKAVLLAWSGSLLFFYAGYYCTHEAWWYLRFILPALPAVGIAAALALQAVPYPGWLISAQRLPAASADPAGGHGLRFTLPPWLLVFSVLWLAVWSRQLHVSIVELEERPYRQVGRWAAEQLPANAVLCADQVAGAVIFYSDRPFIRPDRFTPASYARFNAFLATRNLELYAALFSYEEPDFFQHHMPGRWEPVQRFRQVTIWRRTGLNPSP